MNNGGINRSVGEKGETKMWAYTLFVFFWY